MQKYSESKQVESHAGAGGSFVLAGGVKHRPAALEDSVVVEVFTPWREDYL